MEKNEKKVTLEKVTKKSSSNELFAELQEFSKIGTKKESIYISNLFEGLSEKERNALRRKIRHSRDNMISAFNNAESKDQQKKIAEAWKNFAKKVYKDINVIFEANTTDDKAVIIAKFIADCKQVSK